MVTLKSLFHCGHGAVLSPVIMHDTAQVKYRALLKCVFAIPNDNLFCKKCINRECVCECQLVRHSALFRYLYIDIKALSMVRFLIKTQYLGEYRVCVTPCIHQWAFN